MVACWVTEINPKTGGKKNDGGGYIQVRAVDQIFKNNIVFIKGNAFDIK